MMEFEFKIEEMILHLLEEKKNSAIQDVFSTMSVSELLALFDRVEESQIPVLMGLVPADKADDLIELRGVETGSQKTYLQSTPLDHFRHRIVWLLVLMVSATFTGMII